MRHAAAVTLGRSGVEVSRLGIGGSSLGGMVAPVPDEQAAAVVTEAVALGIRYFDTAPLYGLGLSERRVGQALAASPRESVVLSTKVGRLIRERGAADAEFQEPAMWPEAPDRVPVRDYTGDGVRRSLEESLVRLGLDRVDIVYIHDADGDIDTAISEAIPALARLRDEGVVRAIGLGMNDPEPLVRAVKEADVDCVLIAGRYTLLDRSAGNELLPLCAKRGVGVVVGGVFNSGILARPKPGATYGYRPAPPELLERAVRMEAVCECHGVALATAALQFPLGHPAIGCILGGVRSVKELHVAIEAFDSDVPADLWAELAADSL